MKLNSKLDIKSIWVFLTRRRVLLENKDEQYVFELKLIWFLVALFFFSAIVIGVCLVALLLGSKFSITNGQDHDG